MIFSEKLKCELARSGWFDNVGAFLQVHKSGEQSNIADNRQSKQPTDNAIHKSLLKTLFQLNSKQLVNYFMF